MTCMLLPELPAYNHSVQRDNKYLYTVLPNLGRTLKSLGWGVAVKNQIPGLHPRPTQSELGGGGGKGQPGVGLFFKCFPNYPTVQVRLRPGSGH